MVVGIIISVIVVLIVFCVLVSKRKTRERMALLDAVKKKDKETVQQLMLKGVKVDSYYYGDEKPLSKAVESNDVEMVSILLEKIFNINYSFNNPLSIAIQNGNKDIVSLLIEKGADVNFEKPIYLMSAIKNKNKEIVELLIEKGAEIDIDYDDETPLILAIKNNDIEIVSFLLEKGADPNFDVDEMPLDFAREDDIVALLRSHGAKTKEEQDNIDDEFISSIHGLTASKDESFVRNMKVVFDDDVKDRSYYIEKIKNLIKDISNIDIDLMKNSNPEYSNYTPLMMAVRDEDLELVKLFVEYGANVKARDSFGLSVMYYAVCTNNNVEIIDFLIKHGANVNETFSNEKDSNMTLLMQAAFYGKLENVATLIKNGAYVNAQSEKGLTPLLAAQVKGYTEIEYLLKQNGAWH